MSSEHEIGNKRNMSCLYQRNEIIRCLENLMAIENTLNELEIMSKIPPKEKVSETETETRTEKDTEELYNLSLNVQVLVQSFKPFVERFKHIQKRYIEINQSICEHEIEEDWIDKSPDSYGDNSTKIKYCCKCEKIFS